MSHEFLTCCDLLNKFNLNFRGSASICTQPHAVFGVSLLDIQPFQSRASYRNKKNETKTPPELVCIVRSIHVSKAHS